MKVIHIKEMSPISIKKVEIIENDNRLEELPVDTFKIDAREPMRAAFGSLWKQIIKGEKGVANVVETLLVIIESIMTSFKVDYIGHASDSKDGIWYVSKEKSAALEDWGIDRNSMLENLVENFIGGQLVWRASLHLDAICFIQQIKHCFDKETMNRSMAVTQMAIEGVKHGNLEEAVNGIIWMGNIIEQHADLKPAFDTYRAIVRYSKGGYGSEEEPVRLHSDLLNSVKRVTANKAVLKSNIGKMMADLAELKSNITAKTVDDRFYDNELSLIRGNGVTAGAGIGAALCNEALDIIYNIQQPMINDLVTEGLVPSDAKSKVMNSDKIRSLWKRWDERWTKIVPQVIQSTAAAEDFIAHCHRMEGKGTKPLDTLDNAARFLPKEMLDHILGFLHSKKIDPTRAEMEKYIEPVKVEFGNFSIGNMSMIADSKAEVSKRYTLTVAGLKIWENQIGRIIRFIRAVRVDESLMGKTLDMRTKSKQGTFGLEVRIEQVAEQKVLTLNSSYAAGTKIVRTDVDGFYNTLINNLSSTK